MDAGRYRVEYDPPSDVPAVHLIEPDVTITSTIERDVKLTAGVLAEGVIQAPEGERIGGCEVRVYEAGNSARPSV